MDERESGEKRDWREKREIRGSVLVCVCVCFVYVQCVWCVYACVVCVVGGCLMCGCDLKLV